MQKGHLTKFSICLWLKLSANWNRNRSEILQLGKEYLFFKTTAESGRLNTIPLKLRPRHGCPRSPLLFSIVLEILTSAIKHLKEIQVIQIGKGYIKLSLFANDIIVHVDNSQNKCKIIPRVMSKITGYKVNPQNWLYFYILATINWQLKLRFNTIYISSQWNI